MSTRVTGVTPLGASIIHVAYNIPHTQMATVDAAGGVATWQRHGQSRSWEEGPSWDSQGLSVTCICWAAPEFGNVVCAGTLEGFVCFWAQSAAGEWTRRAAVAASARAATAAAFAPRQMGVGPLAAVAFADGSVKTFLASAKLDAASWDVHSELQLEPTVGGATCLSWREHDPALPLLLVCGTSGGGGAQIWVFREQLLRWERACRLEDGETGGAVSGVAWAPRLGRPQDLVAVASGRSVTLWSLHGAADALQAERVAELQHDHPVWQLGWNMLGNWLAASTEGGEVCMWRPDLAGEWQMFNKIVGGSAEEAQPNGADMMA